MPHQQRDGSSIRENTKKVNGTQQRKKTLNQTIDSKIRKIRTKKKNKTTDKTKETEKTIITYESTYFNLLCQQLNMQVNSKNKSFLFQYVPREYETCLKNNIIMHAFSRIKAYCRHYLFLKFEEERGNKFSNAEKKILAASIHTACYKAYYKQDLASITEHIEIREWFEARPWMTCENITKNYWTAVYTMYELQLALAETQSSFVLFPLYKVSLKHMYIDQSGMWELARMMWPESTPSKKGEFNPKTNTERIRQNWKKLFNIEKFETKNKVFANGLRTDGVTVCVLLEKKKSNAVEMGKKTKKQAQKRKYNNCMQNEQKYLCELYSLKNKICNSIRRILRNVVI